MRRDQRRRRCRSRRAQALPRLAFRRTHARGRARRRARPAARPPRDLTDHRNAVDVRRDRPEHCVLSGLRCAQSGADPVAVQDAAHTIRRRAQKSHRHRSSSRHPHAVVVARPLVVLALPLERFCAGAARRGRAARACRAPARRRADQQGGESCPRGRSGRSVRGPACRRRTCAPDWRSGRGWADFQFMPSGSEFDGGSGSSRSTSVGALPLHRARSPNSMLAYAIPDRRADVGSCRRRGEREVQRAVM
jgi:hypothetical protein